MRKGARPDAGRLDGVQRDGHDQRLPDRRARLGENHSDFTLPSVPSCFVLSFVARSFARKPARLSQVTIIVQGRPKLRANFRALVGIFSQSVGPSLAIWANPVQFSLGERGELRRPCQAARAERAGAPLARPFIY